MRLRHEVVGVGDVDAWDSLLARMSRVAFYHRRGWHEALVTHLVPDVTYHLFEDRRGPLALFPFVSVTICGVARELELPAHRELFVRDCLIADEGLTLPWQHILEVHCSAECGRSAGAFRFHSTPAQSAAATAFPAGHPRIRRDASEGRFFFNVGSPKDVDTLSAKHLRNVDRLRRKAERERGPVRHRNIAGPAAADEGLEEFCVVEESGWKGPDGRGTSVSCDTVLKAFYRDLLSSFAPARDARVDILDISGWPAAAQLALRSGSTWHILKVGFNEDFASFGPGNILLRAFINEMAGDPEVGEVDLVTRPSWAERWHPCEEAAFDVAVFPASPSGGILLARHDLVRRARAALSRARGVRPA